AHTTARWSDSQTRPLSYFCFFFSSRRRHTRWPRDWSSDVCSSDLVDGPTDAAGACVDGGTMARARERGFDPASALAATDSHPLLDATGDLLRTGPTGTNVADLVVALRAAC